MIVTIDPNAPDLDTFKRNDVRLSVIGPACYTVSLTVELLTTDGSSILRKRIGSAIKLPIRPEHCTRRFTQFLGHIDGSDYLFDTACRARLIIDGGTLGSCSIDFKRKSKPLRWATRRKRSAFVVRLIDDSGFESTEATVHSYKIDTPLEASRPNMDTVRTGITVEPPGVLFYAEHNQHHDALVVSDVAKKLGWQGLVISPEIDEIPRKARDLSDAFIVLKRWLDARGIGYQINERRQRIIKGLFAAIYKAICGSNWAKAELRFSEDPNSTDLLEELILRVDNTARLPRALILNRSYIGMSSEHRTKWFTENVTRYGGCKNPEVCEFALQLGYQPSLLSPVSYTEIHELIAQLLNNPEILRSARLLDLNERRTTDGTSIS